MESKGGKERERRIGKEGGKDREKLMAQACNPIKAVQKIKAGGL